MKKLFSIILLVAMLLSVVACSTEPASDNGAQDGTGESAIVREGDFRIKKLTIGGKDISEYTIYHAEDANENIKFAAEELVRLLDIATGVKLPIKVGEAEGTAIEFAVSDDASLKDDGYVYTISDGRMKIEGAAARGASNAVWRFMENECGWENLIYGTSYLNESDHVDIPSGTTKSETPAFYYLNMYNPASTMVNERMTPTLEQTNFGTETQACHGLQANNFAELPDFVNQPCYTDEETYQLIKKNVESYIQGRLDAGEKIGREFKEVDISQIDTSYFCRCSECSKLSREEKSYSALIVKFAIRLSEELNEKYPGLVYKIFAYQGTNKAPATLVPNEYVRVTFCYDRNCSNHLVDGSECEMNEKYNEWISGWSKITDNIFIWDYALPGVFNQYTIIDHLYEDFRYYDSLGIDGIFHQTNEYGDLGFREIENMLISELNWNIDMTKEEFTELYHSILQRRYGAGWENILEYINIMNKAQNKTGCWDCWGGHIPEIQRLDVEYYRDNFDRIIELLDDAKEKAIGEDELKNVEKLYPAVLYTGCQASYFLEFLEGDEERMAFLEGKYTEFIEKYKAIGCTFDETKDLHGGQVTVKNTLYKEAWLNWGERFENWMGQPIPDNAPISKNK